MRESGSEHVYVTHVNGPVANAGVSVLVQSPGASVDPWWLGSLDENDVQGYAGTPVNVNDLMPDVHEDVHAAGVVFPRQQEFYVAVDSGSDFFSGRAGPARYVLNSWVNDVTPPTLKLLNPRHRGAGAGDRRAGDRPPGRGRPRSLVLGPGLLLPAEAFDRATGDRPLPAERAALRADARHARRIRLPGGEERQHLRREHPPEHAPHPRSGARRRRPLVAWLLPAAQTCVGKTAQLLLNATMRPRRARRDAPGAAAAAPAGPLPRPVAPERAGRHLLRASIPGAARRARSLRAMSVAVVTGASSGIGEQLARKLAARGTTPILVARREDRLKALAEELGGEYEVCDVGDREAVEAMGARVLERHPKLDLVVVNAGIPARMDFFGRRAGADRAVTRVNYLGAVWTTRAFLPGLEAAAPSTSSTSSRSPAWSRSAAAGPTRPRSTRSSASRGRSSPTSPGAASACTRSARASSTPRDSRRRASRGTAFSGRSCRGQSSSPTRSCARSTGTCAR